MRHERPNIVLLTVGHTGSSVAMRMLEALGWSLGDADEEYAESRSVRGCNQQKNWVRARADEALAKLPEPWAIKDPRFCERLDQWQPYLEPYRPVLVWLTRDLERVRASYHRRNQNAKVADRRQTAAEEQFDRWTGPKLRIDYEQIQNAVALFQPR